MKNTKRDCKMYEYGCVINPTVPWLGASPDGIVFHEDVGYGLVEVKCSYSKRNVSSRDACQDPSFFCPEVNGKVFLKHDHDYYAQVQGQLSVYGASYCDFMLYTNKGLSIERITFDVVFWRTLTEKLGWVFFRLLCARGENPQVKFMCPMSSAYNWFLLLILYCKNIRKKYTSASMIVSSKNYLHLKHHANAIHSV